MLENRLFSLRENTKSLEDLARRFLRGWEIRSQSREIDTEASRGLQVHAYRHALRETRHVVAPDQR